VVEKAKEMQKEIKELEERIVLIKNLSKVRLREIKAIDYLQNVIPDKVWFSELDFKDTVFQAKGYSVSDEALNKFIEGLEGKSFFRNVILMQSIDQKTKSGTIKSFTFSSSLTATD
jgi:Tfp pilus assembly protein PilN